MARHPKTTLWMLIKVVLKKRYVRVKKAANGRYIPAVIGTYEPGSYYLRYTLNRKRKWESVGSDLNIALQEQKARQASLELVPSATVTTLSTRKTVAEAITKFIANKNGADRHAQRRARGWKWLLDLFSNWWDKIYIDEFTREDFQAFQKYLAKKGRQPRTQCNLLRSLVTFFRASGRVVLFAGDEQEATMLAATVVVKNTLILMSADMPKFTKCKVTSYTEEKLSVDAARSDVTPDKRGGLNGSTQHSARTHLALKTRAKIVREVRSVGTLPWLGFDRVQPNRSVLQGKYCRIN